MLNRYGFASIIFAGLLALVVVLADTGTCSSICRPAQWVPYGDKVGHFVLFGLLSWLVHRAVSGSRRGTVATWGVTAVLIAIIAVEEVSQAWYPHRTADVIDFVASVAGVLVARWLAVRTSTGFVLGTTERGRP